MEIQLPLLSSKELSLRDQRAVLLTILYAADSLDYTVSLESIIDNLHHGFSLLIGPEDTVYQQALSIIAERNDLDEQVKPLLDNWRFDRLSVCTRLILRIGLWEMIHSHTSPTIIINEAVELAKGFAETDAYKFVNGILDEWIKRNRPQDMAKHEPVDQESSPKNEEQERSE